jgi:hypothetical protein
MLPTLTVLRGVVGLEEPTARAVVADLADYRPGAA